MLLGALLQQHANPGPAGVPPKRDWTYRHATWLGHALGCGLDMPARHPFNPLPLLRQALACSDDGTVNRYVAGTVLRHVWLGGQDALDPARLDVLAQALAEQLRPDAEGAGALPKALLRARLWWPEARVAPGSFPSMNAMLRAQLGSAVVTETDEQARERYRAQLADEGLAHHLR